MNFKNIFGFVSILALCTCVLGGIMLSDDSSATNPLTETQTLTVGTAYSWYPGIPDADTYPSWVEGDLPPGITNDLNVPTNQLYFSGTPTTSGTYTVSVYHIDDVTTGEDSYVYMTITFVVTAGTVEETYTHTATLVYDANGGTGAPVSQTASITSVSSVATGSCTFTISSVEPVRNNYTFKGWLTIISSVAVGGMSSGSDVSVDYGSTVTLYAVWVVPHVIVYDFNNGSEETFDQVLTDTQLSATMIISDIVPVYPDHTLLGWSYHSDSVEPMFVAGDTISVDVAITLFAVWAVDDGEDDDDDDFAITSDYPTVTFTEGMSYVYDLTSTDENSTWEITGVSWLSLDNSTVSGTVPDIVSGQTSITFVIAATSSDGQTATQTVTIIVSDGSENDDDSLDIHNISIVACLIVLLILIAALLHRRH